jgi:DNA polymerase III alpha subunit
MQSIPDDNLKHGFCCIENLISQRQNAWALRSCLLISIGYAGKTVRTKKGDHMKFISFEDKTGIYETVLFSKVYNRYCHMLNASRPYILKGTMDEDFGSFNIIVQWIGFLDRYRDKNPVNRKPKFPLIHPFP